MGLLTNTGFFIYDFWFLYIFLIFVYFGERVVAVSARKDFQIQLLWDDLNGRSMNGREVNGHKLGQPT